MGNKPEPTNYRIELGLRLKKCRENKFVSSKECAGKYGVSPSMWSDMEKGRVVFSPEKIIHLAEFLGVSPGWLLTGESKAGVDNGVSKKDLLAAKKVIQNGLERLEQALEDCD